MFHHLTYLALLLSFALLPGNELLASSISTSETPVSLGNDCLQIIDPETGLSTTALDLGVICQGDNVDYCITTAGCDNNVEIIGFSGNLGQVITTPPSSPFDFCFSYTAPADLIGEDNFTLEITNTTPGGTVESTVFLDVVFSVADPQNNTTVSAPQEICSPANSATIEAFNPDPIVGGYWVILQGGGTIADVTSPVVEVTDIPFGESIFMWRQDYPCQSTFDLTTVTLYDGQAPVANAGESVNLCSDEPTYILQANDPQFSATGTWEITFGNATINDINDPNATVSNIGVGCNIFEWNISNGPCPGGETVDQMIICMYDQNTPAANAGEDIELCFDFAGANSVTTSANSLEDFDPATGSWSPVEGFGVIEDSDDHQTVIDNLQIGTNIFTWEIENGPCPVNPTIDTLEIRVYDPNHPQPNAGADAEFCAPLDSYVLEADEAISPAVGTWSVISGSGSFSDINDPSATVTNLSVGANTFRWTIYNGPCNSGDFFNEVTITIFDPNVAEADAGVDIDLCQDGFTSLTLQASAFTEPATGVWTVESPDGITAEEILSDVNDPSAILSGIAPAAYILRWTVNNGPCAGTENFAEITVSLFPSTQLMANAGNDQDLCTPISNFNLSANSPVEPGVGEWTLITGGGAILEPNSPSSEVTNLAVGDNVFRWTITNGDCEDIANFDDVVISVFNIDAAPADAGINQEFCGNFGSVLEANLNGNVPEAPALGTWSVVSGSGTINDQNDPNTTISGLVTGTTVLQWSIDNGACSVSSNTDQIVIEVYNDNEPDAEAGENQQICSDLNEVTLNATQPSNPHTGSWSLVQGQGVFSDQSDPTSTVSGLALGNNTFRWTVDNGPCSPPFSFDDVIITVFDENVGVANAGDDLEICDNFGSVDLNASQFTAPATGEWVVIEGAGVFTNTTSPTSSVTGWQVGTNIYEWRVNNGPCSGGENNDQITVTVFSINADQANAGVDQEICTPQTSTSLGAIESSFPSVGSWSVVQGSGLFLDDTDPETLVSGLSIGENIFEWTINNGACSPIFSQDRVSVFLFEEGTAVANAGLDQNFCEPVSDAVLNANIPESPFTGVWTLESGSGVINDATDPNTTVSNLGQGVNVFQWTIDNGPCEQEQPSDQVTLNVFEENHPPAFAGEDIELCAPESETVMNASLPIEPATGAWIQVEGPNTASLNPADPAAAVSNLIPGVYVFQWQIDNGPCNLDPLTDQMTISVFDSNADLANAGDDISVCTPVTNVTLGANPAQGAAVGFWTLVSGNGSILNVNDPSTVVTNLTVGENIFVWTIDNNDCGFGLSTDTVSVFVFDSSSPDAFAGLDQSLCTPQSTSELTGNQPVFPASVQWELVSGSGVVTDPNNFQSEVTGLSIGENTFRYTVFNGNCPNSETTDEIIISVFDSGAPAAEAGENQEICTPQSSTLMAATSAVDPGVGTWSLVSGPAGLIIDDLNNPLTEISNLSIGTYVLEWSLDYSTCGTQADQVTITVFDSDLPSANAGSDITVCLPGNSAGLNATPIATPAIGTWSVISGAATFSDVNAFNATVSNLSVGENVLQWQVYNGPCSDLDAMTDEVIILVYEEDLPSAEAGDNQEFCTSSGTTINAVMNAEVPEVPATGSWTVIQGGGTFTDPSDPLSNLTSVPIGVNIYQWSVEYGSCAASSSDEVEIVVYNSDQPAANAGEDQSFCTPVALVQLEGNTPVTPATGEWTQIVGTASISDVNDPSATLTNIGVGVTILRWTIENGPCDPSSTNDLVTIFVYDENAADAEVGSDQEICLPENSSNLEGNLPVFPGVGTWSQLEGTSTISNNNNPNSPVSNLSAGENIFIWEVFNGPCANSITTDTLRILVFDPDNPEANAGENVDLCSFDSSVTLTAVEPILPATGQWVQVLGEPATIANPESFSTQVENLAIGINTFQWSIYNGPCENSISSDIVSINVFDQNQAPAFAGEDQSLCLPVSQTTFAAAPLTEPSMGSWNLVSGQGSITDINNPTSAVTNLGIGENIFTWSVSNGPCEEGPTADTVVINVFDPNAAFAITEPDIQLCAPVGNLTITANEALGAALGTWSVVSGDAEITEPNNFESEITGLEVGIYQFEWFIDNGACGTSTDVLNVEIFDPNNPQADAGENQNYCTPITSATLSGSEAILPASGEWQIIIGDGNILEPNNPTSEVTNLLVGETIMQWTVDNGPCSGVTSDFVSIFIFDESAPDAFAGIDQEQCFPVTNATLSATEAVFPAIGSWSLIEGSGTIQNINSPNTEITGLEVGINSFVWSIDNSPCDNGLTRDTVSVLVYPNEFTLANAGVDQDLCSPASEATMSATQPDDPSSGIWSLVSGSGSISDLNDPNAEITQLGIGTNIFSWLVYHGPCEPETSVDVMTISVYDENHPPANAGEDQEFCTPVNSTNLNAEPTSDPAVGSWSLISGAGNVEDINDAGSEVTGLLPGENCFVWSVSNGPCENDITTDTVCVLIFDASAPPADAGEDINLCGESSVSLNALEPASPAEGFWNIVSGPGSGSFDDNTNPNAELSGLIIGQYTLQWIVNNGPCDDPISSDQMILNVFDANLEEAFAGDTLEFCAPVDEIQLNASGFTFPASGTWSTDSDLIITDINDPNSTVTNAAVGEYTLTWTVSNGPCSETSDDLTIFVFDPLNTESLAGPDQSICTDDINGSQAVMSANTPISPSTGEWVTIFGDEPNISDINDPNATMSDFGFGETQLIWQIYNGPCDAIIEDAVSIFHFDSNESDAEAGDDQEFCGIPLAVDLNANPTIGNTAVGTWSVVNSPEGSAPLNFTDINEESAVVSGFETGVYTLTWTVDNGECGITSDEVTINIFDPLVDSPSVGEDFSVCEDEFELEPSLILEGNPVDLPATVLWSVIDGDPIIDQTALNTTNPEVTYLGDIQVPLTTVTNSFLYTINNGPCGSESDTLIVTLIDCLTIDIPDAISPNGDFFNETWEIPNLIKYPNNNMKIFNRWGSKIFEENNYQGGWNGTSSHPSTIGEELPVGTYFYLLDLGDGSPTREGYVYLKR